MRDDFIFFLLLLTIANVIASVAVVAINLLSPLSMRFNLSYLAATCLLGGINVAMYYRWF